MGCIGVVISGGKFGAPFGGAVGFVAGLIMVSIETIKTPGNLRESKFATQTGSGKIGSGFRQDSRYVFVGVLSVMGGLSTFLLQIAARLLGLN